MIPRLPVACLLSLFAVSQGFSVVPAAGVRNGLVVGSSVVSAPRPISFSALGMTADAGEEQAPEVAETEEIVSEEEEEDEEVVVEEEEEEPVEDPELTALKEEIAQAEQDLKEKRRQVALTSDSADEVSEAGYARKVAEMEQMQRTRRMLQSSDSSSAVASILMEFLSVREKLNKLRDTFGEDDFGKQYSGISIQSAFTAMGVTEYTVEEGMAVDVTRMRAVESQVRDDVAADTILQVLSNGLELEGNVLNKAEVISSSAPAAEEEAAAPAE